MKNKTIKKALGLMLTAILCCGLFAGCGQKKTEESSEEIPAASEAAENASEETAEETVNITWYRNMASDYTDEKSVETAINEYIEPLIGVTVSIVNAGDVPDLSLELASNADIDLFWAAWWNGGQSYVLDGAALDITDVLQDYPELQNSIPANIWEGAQINERNYYVPVYKEAAEGQSIAYSVEMAEKYGWDMSKVKSLADLTPLLEEASADGVTHAFIPLGGMFKTINKDTYSMITNTVGINRTTKEVVNLAEIEEFAEFTQMMYEWNQEGYINADHVDVQATTDAEIADYFAADDTAFCHFTTVPDADATASLRYGEKIGVIPLTKNYISALSPFGSAYLINAKTEKADACLKFLSLLSTDEKLANLAAYGIEGTHYTLNDEGRVVLTEGSGYGYGVWSTVNVNAPTLMEGESADKKEQYSTFNENAEVDLLAGFSLDATNIEAETAAIEAVYQEYNDLLEFGFYDPDEYLPKYQQALKDAGIDKVISEAQTQIDAWLASK